MTVTNTSVRIQYTGDGNTLNYPFPFNLLTDLNAGVVVNPADVQVYFGSALQSTSSYSVNGPYASPANTVILNAGTAPLSGTVITIVRAKPQTQTTRYLNGAAFPASSFELALDKLTMLIQQLQDQINRSPTLPVTTTAATLAFPPPGAGKVIGWDSSGTVLTLYSLVTTTGWPSAATYPSTGAHLQGEVVLNSNPLAGGVLGWVCTVAG